MHRAIRESCSLIIPLPLARAGTTLGTHSPVPCSSIDLAVPYEVLFLFDTLIFVLTVYKTCEMGLRGSVFAMITSPHHLVALLLRDGELLICRYQGHIDHR